jgi:cell division protein FtsB
MTQRAIDISKGVLPVGIMVAVIVALAAAIFGAGIFYARVVTLERDVAAVPTSAQLDTLRKQVTDLEARLNQYRSEMMAENERRKDELATEASWRERVRIDLAEQGWKTQERKQ